VQYGRVEVYTMRTRFLHVAAAAVLAVVLTPSPARADWILTPFLGVSFGGETKDQHLTYGGSLTWMSSGVFGLELDAAFAPDLLDDEGDVDFSLGSNSVGTVMANLVIGAPLGERGLRPYVSGGAGLMRIHVDNALDVFDLDDDSFGVNVGAGVTGFMSEHVGLRADVRYFRRLQDSDTSSGIDLDLGSFNFWRATLGLALRF
jgi:opacity protein-like surface antigen